MKILHFLPNDHCYNVLHLILKVDIADVREIYFCISRIFMTSVISVLIVITSVINAKHYYRAISIKNDKTKPPYFS